MQSPQPKSLDHESSRTSERERLVDRPRHRARICIVNYSLDGALAPAQRPRDSLNASYETQPKSHIVEEKKCINESVCPGPRPGPRSSEPVSRRFRPGVSPRVLHTLSGHKLRQVGPRQGRRRLLF